MSLHTSQNPYLYSRIHHHLLWSKPLLHLYYTTIMHFLHLILLFTTVTALQSPLGITMSLIHPRTRTKTGNPVINGWYADPEARIFTSSQNPNQNQKQYWIYPTTSASYDKQTTFSAFSSPDLLTWTPHPHILNITQIPWSTNRAAWAPSVTCRDGEYYMYFSVGDGAGIGVARSETGQPQGPFRDVLGKALVPGVVMGAQGIDAQVFIDHEGAEDGEVVGGVDGQGGGKGRNWLYFGGWGHAVVVELGEDMVSLKGEYKEITPEGYVEGPWVLKGKGVYYFMFSVGGWGDNSYGVSYVTGSSPTGPFSSTPRNILQGNENVGTGTGHNSVFTPDGKDYYIVYHRRYPNDTARDHRVTCIDRMEFDADGNIKPVVITNEGVEGRQL